MASSSTSSSTSTGSSSKSTLRSNIELDYEGPVKRCYCKVKGLRMKAPRWTSWTDKNPGRRFYGCSNYLISNCGYFEWHDEPMNNRVKDVINELKVEIKLLLIENRRLMSKEKIVATTGELEAEIDELWSQLRALKKSKVKECDMLRKRMITAYVIVVITWMIMFSVFVLF